MLEDLDTVVPPINAIATVLELAVLLERQTVTQISVK